MTMKRNCNCNCNQENGNCKKNNNETRGCNRPEICVNTPLYRYLTCAIDDILQDQLKDAIIAAMWDGDIPILNIEIVDSCGDIQERLPLYFGDALKYTNDTTAEDLLESGSVNIRFDKLLKATIEESPLIVASNDQIETLIQQNAILQQMVIDLNERVQELEEYYQY